MTWDFEVSWISGGWWSRNPAHLTTLCFVGQITELGKRGIVSMVRKTHRPLDGETITIYAYTIEGDHLKKHQLAQYEEGENNAVFDKYLAEDKRTHVQLQEIDP